jgi:hypothetical protein
VKAQDHIRQWATAGGIKLSWLSAQVPAKPGSLSRWLSGTAVPSPVYRHRLADITGIDSLRDEGNWIKPEDIA